jgi:uncharacterized membrane protein/thiol-disulfide isomerase/thioredoxin
MKPWKRRALYLLRFIGMLGFIALLASPGVSFAQTETPVVHILLFWTPDCHACREVVTEAIPPLMNSYGEQIEVQYVDVVTGDDVQRFYQVAAAFGIAQEEADLPMVVIGEHALIGSERIPAELPGLVEMYLAGGGVELPDISRLVEAQATTEAVLPEHPSGFWLAIGTMIGMIAAMVFSGLAFSRLATALPGRFTAQWTGSVIPLLSLAGLGVASYLAYVETQAVCGPVGDCNAVQASPYARLFGVLPVGMLGMLGYLLILAAWGVYKLRRDRLGDWAALAMFDMAFSGVLFSLYLTYLEPFVIKAVCLWCLTSAGIMTLLLLATLRPALQANQNLLEGDRPHAEIETPSA